MLRNRDGQAVGAGRHAETGSLAPELGERHPSRGGEQRVTQQSPVKTTGHAPLLTKRKDGMLTIAWMCVLKTANPGGALLVKKQSPFSKMGEVLRRPGECGERTLRILVFELQLCNSVPVL